MSFVTRDSLLSCLEQGDSHTNFNMNYMLTVVLHSLTLSYLYYPWIACSAFLWVIAFTHMFIQQIFIECQLYARHRAGMKDIRANNKDIPLSL